MATKEKRTPEQQKILDDIDLSINKLVASTAGSGKTTVGSEHSTRCIEKNVLKKDQVISFTFTRVAADRMASATSKKLQFVLDYLPVAERKLDHCDTIHAFSKRMLKKHKVLPPESDLYTTDEYILLFLFWLRSDDPKAKQFLANVKLVQIDEVQDVNELHIAVAKEFQKNGACISGFGEDIQSIFAFQGSDVKFIRQFAEIFSPCITYHLSINFRCTKPIVDLANMVIDCGRKEEYLPKPPAVSYESLMDPIPQSPKPKLLHYSKIWEVVKTTADIISNGLQEKKVEPHNIFVLCRNRYLQFQVQAELAKRNVKTVFLNHIKGTERPTIRNGKVQVVRHNSVVEGTIHNAKGEQAKWVFILTMHGTLFPDHKEPDIEKERRLFYVGITRAEERLFIWNCFDCPSLFIREIYDRTASLPNGIQEIFDTNILCLPDVETQDNLSSEEEEEENKEEEQEKEEEEQQAKPTDSEDNDGIEAKPDNEVVAMDIDSDDEDVNATSANTPRFVQTTLPCTRPKRKNENAYVQRDSKECDSAPASTKKVCSTDLRKNQIEDDEAEEQKDCVLEDGTEDDEQAERDFEEAVKWTAILRQPELEFPVDEWISNLNACAYYHIRKNILDSDFKPSVANIPDHCHNEPVPSKYQKKKRKNDSLPNYHPAPFFQYNCMEYASRNYLNCWILRLIQEMKFEQQETHNASMQMSLDSYFKKETASVEVSSVEKEESKDEVGAAVSETKYVASSTNAPTSSFLDASFTPDESEGEESDSDAYESDDPNSNTDDDDEHDHKHEAQECDLVSSSKRKGRGDVPRYIFASSSSSDDDDDGRDDRTEDRRSQENEGANEGRDFVDEKKEAQLIQQKEKKTTKRKFVPIIVPQTFSYPPAQLCYRQIRERGQEIPKSFRGAISRGETMYNSRNLPWNQILRPIYLASTAESLRLGLMTAASSVPSTKTLDRYMPIFEEMEKVFFDMFTNTKYQYNLATCLEWQYVTYFHLKKAPLECEHVVMGDRLIMWSSTATDHGDFPVEMIFKAVAIFSLYHFKHIVDEQNTRILTKKSKIRPKIHLRWIQIYHVMGRKMCHLDLGSWTKHQEYLEYISTCKRDVYNLLNEN